MKAVKPMCGALAVMICATAQAQTWGQLLNSAAQAAKSAVTGQPPAQTQAQPSQGGGCHELVMSFKPDCWAWPAGSIRIDAAVTPSPPGWNSAVGPYPPQDQNIAVFADAVQLDAAGHVALLHEEDTRMAAASAAYANARSFDRQDQAAAAREAAKGLVERYPLDGDYVLGVKAQWFEYDMQHQQFPVRFELWDRKFRYDNPDVPGKSLALSMMIPQLYQADRYPGTGGLKGEYDVPVPLAQAHAFNDAVRRNALPNAPVVYTYAMLHLKPVALKTLEQEPVSSKDHWPPALMFVDYRITGITWCDAFGRPVELGAGAAP